MFIGRAALPFRLCCKLSRFPASLLCTAVPASSDWKYSGVTSVPSVFNELAMAQPLWIPACAKTTAEVPGLVVSSEIREDSIFPDT